VIGFFYVFTSLGKMPPRFISPWLDYLIFSYQQP